MVYSAMDLIVTPDGRHVFLENNPCGQYGWVEAVTGLPITDRLVEALCQEAIGRNGGGTAGCAVAESLPCLSGRMAPERRSFTARRYCR